MNRRDRWLRLLAGGAAAGGLMLSGGCSSMSQTQRGMGLGAAGGAGVGALIGSASGNAGKGALIGTAVGAIGGALVGNDAEQQEKRQLEAQVAESQQVRGSLTLQDVVNMTQQRVSEPVIINQIRSSGTVYNLNAPDVQYLQSQGVSDTIILEMQNSRRRVAPQPRMVVAPPPPPMVVQPVYVVPPPPPPAVGIGFSYRSR